MRAEQVRQELRERLGVEARPAQAADAVAGVRPALVAEPGSEEALAAVLAYADGAGLKVLVRGGGTQMGLGAPPTGADLLLCTTRLRTILEHAPHDQTVTVQAGITLAAVQTALASTRQHLALDPALPPGTTIGGILSTNASGARRLRYGGVRDQLLGVRVALADGTLARGGSKVVKNVAGYDLPKLYTGALGTLGVIVAATLRLYPLPAVRRTVLLRSSEPAPLWSLALAVNASTLVPAAMDLVAPQVPGDPLTLAVRFEFGSLVAAEEQCAALRMLAGALPAATLADAEESAYWQRLDAHTSTAPEGDAALLLKASLLPTEQAGWVEALCTQCAEVQAEPWWRAHAGHGLVLAWVRGAADDLPALVERLRAVAQGSGGSLVVRHAPAALAGRLDVWGGSPALGLMRRLKASFDPHGTLNPGRFLGGI